MQDFLPDVNDLKINEDKKIVAGLSKKKTLSKKQITRLAIAGVFGLLIFFGVLASFLENRDKKIVIEKEKESLNERAKLIEKKPGQMSWLFYLDFNENNSFDYEEKVFSGVSVKVRKPGEAQILRTMPANVLGQVIIDDLAEGEYEINFDNYAKDNFNEGEFSFPGMYQIVRDEDNFKEFLPSSWQKVILDMEGYYNKVGVVEYKPESLLVLEGDNKILFYDPFRSRLIGWSNFKLQGSTLKLDKLYFLKDSKLKELDIKTRIVKTNMDWVYEVGEYKLSSDGRMMVYKENNQFQYKSIDCGSGAVLIDGNRLKLKEMLVDFLSSDKLIVAGKVLEEDYKIYQLVCNNNDLVAREIIKTEASSLVCLNDKTIFYSDSGGSYFYDLTDDSKVKYTALGNNVLVKVSSDKKYIGAMVGSKFLVVDYPAVKASGVEKHYLIDRVSSIDEVGFSGDSILVNQAKTCQSDGDCGEILRINLFGSGVWKIEDRVQLKNVVVEKILGEIKF